MSHYKDRGFFKNFLTYFKYFKNYRSKLYWAFSFSIIRLIPRYSFPIFVKIRVDSYIPAGNLKNIYLMIGVVVVLGILRIIYQTGYAILRTDVTQNISKDLRNIIVNKLQILSLSYHDRAETGRYYSKIMVDVERIRKFTNIFIHINFISSNN